MPLKRLQALRIQALHYFTSLYFLVLEAHSHLTNFFTFISGFSRSSYELSERMGFVLAFQLLHLLIDCRLEVPQVSS